MATNKVQTGSVLQIAQSGVSSGDPVEQNDLTGVALNDTDSDGNIRLDTEGVFDLTVEAKNDGGNVAVSIGDKLYYDSGATIKINKDDTSGTLYGYALEEITSGESDTINVRLINA